MDAAAGHVAHPFGEPLGADGAAVDPDLSGEAGGAAAVGGLVHDESIDAGARRLRCGPGEALGGAGVGHQTDRDLAHDHPRGLVDERQLVVSDPPKRAPCLLVGSDPPKQV